MNHVIETVGGYKFDLANPRAEDVKLFDIAHALSNTCRFGGHSIRFYSVAEHAVRVSFWLDFHGMGSFALAGLHHDDAEAYIGDVPRPLKSLIGPEYASLSDQLDEVIVEALAGGRWTVDGMHSEIVKEADDAMLRTEALSLMRSQGRWWNDALPEPGLRQNMGWSPAHARMMYLSTHNALAA